MGFAALPVELVVPFGDGFFGVVGDGEEEDDDDDDEDDDEDILEGCCCLGKARATVCMKCVVAIFFCYSAPSIPAVFAVVMGSHNSENGAIFGRTSYWRT